MGKIRLFLEHTLFEGQFLYLDSEQTHYLVTVMRLKTGDSLHVFNGIDGEWLAKIDDSKGKILQCVTQSKPQNHEQNNAANIKLIFAPLKKKRTNWVVEKACELGVKEIFPVLTDYTSTKHINEQRLRKYAIEAAEQCGRITVPRLHALQSLPALFLAWSPHEPIIFCDVECEDKTIERVLMNWKVVSACAISSCAILIGPEGSFSAEERAYLLKQPFVHGVSLGADVLRAETAAIAAIAVAQSVFRSYS